MADRVSRHIINGDLPNGVIAEHFYNPTPDTATTFGDVAGETSIADPMEQIMEDFARAQDRLRDEGS